MMEYLLFPSMLIFALVGSLGIIIWLIVRLVLDWRENQRRWDHVRHRNAPTYGDLYKHDYERPRPNVKGGRR